MRTLLFYICTIIGLSAFGQAADASIQGTISDLELNGEPLMFANVELVGTELHTETNFNGNFEFTNLKSGTYTVQISALGYEPKNILVELKDSEAYRIDSGLEAKSVSINDIPSEVSLKELDSKTIALTGQ